jgi:hypothetical protein
MIKINSLIIALIACSVFVTSLNAVPKSPEALFKEYKSKKVLLKEELAHLKWKSWKNYMGLFLVYSYWICSLKVYAPLIVDKTAWIKAAFATGALYVVTKYWAELDRNLSDEESTLQQQIRDVEEKLQQTL